MKYDMYLTVLAWVNIKTVLLRMCEITSYFIKKYIYQLQLGSK